MTVRRRATQVGRLRVRMAALMEPLGFRVNPAELHASQGYWRIGKYEEGPAWSGRGIRLSDGRGVEFSAHATMTECVRLGLVISPGDGPGHYWVDPKAWCRVCNLECHCPWLDADEHHCRMAVSDTDSRSYRPPCRLA